MSNFLDRIILHSNLEILRSLTGLNKGKFAKLIGVANVYRKDFDTIGPKLMKGITDNFQGVDEMWLASQHPEGAEGIKFTPRRMSNNDPYHIPLVSAPVATDNWKDEYIAELRKENAELRKRVDRLTAPSTGADQETG